MVEASVPVDVFNPGQVFACIGLMEAADILLGDAEGAFDWSDGANVRFHLRAAGEFSPIAVVLEFLDTATASAIAPPNSPSVGSWTPSWGPAPTVCEHASGYPFPDPDKPATLLCLLSDGRRKIAIDHYGDKTRENVKFWAGAGGYPGAALARDALALVAGRAAAAASDPFSLTATQSSSFRLDWRRDYIPIDAGFSINSHDDIKMMGFPLVELLGAIGLTHARPKRPEPRNKLQYVYGLVGRAREDGPLWLPPSILRAALGAVALPFSRRRFRMLLDWPGQEGQARAITTVTEETIE